MMTAQNGECFRLRARSARGRRTRTEGRVMTAGPTQRPERLTRNNALLLLVDHQVGLYTGIRDIDVLQCPRSRHGDRTAPVVAYAGIACLHQASRPQRRRDAAGRGTGTRKKSLLEIVYL